MSNNQIVSEALSLPLADRLYIVNQIIESFNPINPQVEPKWKEELKSRQKLLKSGKAQTLSYQEFFDSFIH
ncbi:MAG: addiction module protein [Campylobacterota bacterium]|nr:addiction module protein [Campylobacterota bacterium]